MEKYSILCKYRESDVKHMKNEYDIELIFFAPLIAWLIIIFFIWLLKAYLGD